MHSDTTALGNLKLGDLSINLANYNGMGIEIKMPYVTDMGTTSMVILNLFDMWINIAATGTLNSNGIVASGLCG